MLDLTRIRGFGRCVLSLPFDRVSQESKTMRNGRLFLALCVVVLLWPASAPAKVKLAVMDLSPLGVEPAVASTYTQLVGAEINETGLFTVISRQDIKSMLDFEQDRRLVGCEADAACMAEIGGALGVEYVLSGSVGLLAGKHMLNLQLLDIKRAKVESRVKRTIPPGEEKATLEELRKAAHALVRPIRKGNTGFLALECSEEGASVYLDESLAGVTPLPQKPLPGGEHEVVLRKKGFVEWASEVNIGPGELSKLSVVLTPSQEYIGDYERKAQAMRYLAWGTLGLAVLGTAGSTWFYLSARENSELLQEANKKLELQPGDRKAQQQADQAYDQGTTQYTLYWVLMGSAILTGTSSTLLFYLGDPPDRYRQFEQGSGVTIGPGPGLAGLSVGGSF